MGQKTGKFFVFVALATAMFGCNTTEDLGDGDESGTGDPRCESLCVVQEPSLSGAYDICSAESAAVCKEDCAAHIAGVSSLCATCLLEDACFDANCAGSGSTAVSCFFDGAGTTCAVTGREGSCTYPGGDQTARDNCIRQVYPRRTVGCSPDYRPVTECNSICGG